MQRVLAASKLAFGMKPSGLHVALMRGFSGNDTFKDRGNAAENEWARKENEKKLKNLKSKLAQEKKREVDDDDVNVDDVLEDRDFLVVGPHLTQKKLKEHKIENETLIKELIRWKYGKY